MKTSGSHHVPSNNAPEQRSMGQSSSSLHVPDAWLLGCSSASLIYADLKEWLVGKI